jgi:RES domain-containing protein
MEVFRLSRSKYANALTASGAAGRWNFDDEYVLYTGASRSLATLERLAHANTSKLAGDYEMMIISIPNGRGFYHEIRIEDLPGVWRFNFVYSELQKIGSDWYTKLLSPVLKVPSAVIPREYNYILNSTHPDFSKISLNPNEEYFWDARLIEMFLKV